MFNKKAMPTKNLIILISLMTIFLIGVGSLIYFFGGDNVFQNWIQNQEELSKDYSLVSDDFINSFGVFSKTEIDRRNLRDKILIDNIIKSNGLDPQQTYSELKQYHQEIISEVSDKLGISKEQAKKMIIIVEEQRSNYPNLDDKDAYQMVLADFMSYEEKVDNQLQLPEAYLNEPKMLNGQVALVLKGTTLKSFPELLVDAGIGIWAPQSSTSFTSILKGEKIKQFDFSGLIEEAIYQALNITPLEFEKTFCTLGSPKTIILRADYLISNKGFINYTYDKIIYGPDGIVIPELSKKDFFGQYSSNYTSETFIIPSQIEIPLDYPGGEYIIEYTIYNYNTLTKTIERVPLKCLRTLFFKNFDFVNLLGEDIALKRGSSVFSPGENISLAFEISGFSEKLKNESKQFQISIKIVDQNGSIFYEMPPVVQGNLIIEKEGGWNHLLTIQPKSEMPPGEYFILIKIKDLINDNILRNGKILVVKK